MVEAFLWWELFRCLNLVTGSWLDADIPRSRGLFKPEPSCFERQSEYSPLPHITLGIGDFLLVPNQHVFEGILHDSKTYLALLLFSIT